MSTGANILGSDIGLTRFSGVPSSVPLTRADSWGTLDAALVPGMRGGLASEREPKDLGAATSRDNLAQALILRLLTPVGSLAPMGHAQYGSRLVELIGENNTELARIRARLFTLQALRQEPRVADVLGLTVSVANGQPGTLLISFSVMPITGGDPLDLGLEVTL